MYSDAFRMNALDLLVSGRSANSVARELGVSRAALKNWQLRGHAARSSAPCFRCHGLHPTQGRAYSAVLGYYLGDGCVSVWRTKVYLRVVCDQRLPGIVQDVEQQVRELQPQGRPRRVLAPGVVVVHTNWKHWTCLVPQHGPGRKHDRQIVLEPWQEDVIRAFPAPFLRGLFHSDGCRSNNWTSKLVAGQRKRYDYPRWQFTNRSEDILQLCGWALDLVGIDWRRSAWDTLSVSRREAVARLDELIGLKS